MLDHEWVAAVANFVRTFGIAQTRDFTASADHWRGRFEERKLTAFQIDKGVDRMLAYRDNMRQPGMRDLFKATMDWHDSQPKAHDDWQPIPCDYCGGAGCVEQPHVKDGVLCLRVARCVCENARHCALGAVVPTWREVGWKAEDILRPLDAAGYSRQWYKAHPQFTWKGKDKWTELNAKYATKIEPETKTEGGR